MSQLVMIRSVWGGNIRCLKKGTKCYGGRENIFTCSKCKFNTGFYKLPKAVVVACAKRYYPAWQTQTCAIFEINSLKHFSQININEITGVPE
jgi:hypothetical protein